MTESQDAKSLELDLTRKNNICTLLCGSVYRPVHDSVHMDENTVYVCACGRLENQSSSFRHVSSALLSFWKCVPVSKLTQAVLP